MIAVDNWRDSQASVMAAQEEGHAEALRRMEQQARGRQAPGTTCMSWSKFCQFCWEVQELASEVVEQQAAFQALDFS